jgi:prepilin-type N-terminal cleavage/methylation domain-containing protein
MNVQTARKRAFSLVELVVVIVIIGILAAIAIPRLSRGTVGASQSALAGNLKVVRGAISLYFTEHNNNFPGPTAANFEDQLTQYTSLAGATQASKDNVHRFGPYLAAIPPCPVGENAGKPTASDVLIDNANSPPNPNPASAGEEGWVYNPNTGEFLPNTNQNDDTGTPFTSY